MHTFIPHPQGILSTILPCFLGSSLPLAPTRCDISVVSDLKTVCIPCCTAVQSKEAIHIRLHPDTINRDSGIEIPEVSTQYPLGTNADHRGNNLQSERQGLKSSNQQQPKQGPRWTNHRQPWCYPHWHITSPHHHPMKTRSKTVEMLLYTILLWHNCETND